MIIARSGHRCTGVERSSFFMRWKRSDGAFGSKVLTDSFNMPPPPYQGCYHESPPTSNITLHFLVFASPSFLQEGGEAISRSVISNQLSVFLTSPPDCHVPINRDSQRHISLFSLN